MRILSPLIAAALLLAVSSAPAPAQKPEVDDGRYFFFKDGDTVVIMGDSITEQMLYSDYVEMWSVARFPKRKLTFRNVGIGGDTAPGGNNRFARDVLAHKATVLTVDFGMNDGHTKDFSEQRYQNFMKGLQGIADQAKKGKVRVAWITPQPCEYRSEGPVLSGVNPTLERFAEGVEQIALKNGGPFVDQFHPYMAVLAKARSADAKNVNITGGDPVHPGPTGQVVMAAAILKRLDFQQLVARVAITIDPATGNRDAKIETENCQAKIAATGKDDGPALTLTWLDHSLPFFPDEAAGILKWSPIRDEMNRYLLQVKGLAAGKYAIQLNDARIGEYTAEQLAKGVNLAGHVLTAGPVAEQVKKVWSAVKQKNRYFHDQVFRGVVLANAKSPVFKDVDAKDIETRRTQLYAERMKKMPELDAAVRDALVMKEHRVSIVPLLR